MAGKGGDVIYKLRDTNLKIVTAWQQAFSQYSDRVEVSSGDIFTNAPGCDAIVSPANSFGFMDGGIDRAFSLHFGWQMQERLQKIYMDNYDGELPVGCVIIMPTYEGGATKDSRDWKGFNDGRPIKFLISAPTMRVPLDVADTANAYQAFRAIILAVRKHNADGANEPIRSVLCPGLATAVGKMPPERCAYQMLRAFECWDLGLHPELRQPQRLKDVRWDHYRMREYAKGMTDGPMARGKAMFEQKEKDSSDEKP